MALGTGCILGTFFGLRNGYYLLALAQIAFAAALVMILLEVGTKGRVYLYSIWTCLGVGIVLTAIASAS